MLASPPEADEPSEREAPPGPRPRATAAAPSAPVAAPRDPCAAALEIVVLDSEGGRVPGASVELWAAPDGAQETGEARLLAADARGTLEQVLAPGEVRAVAWSEVGASEPAELLLRAGERRRVELQLAPRPALEGRVVDALTGAGLAAARISCWTYAELDVVLTDADGRFRHPRFPGGEAAHQVRIERDGYGAAVRYLVVDALAGWEVLAATEEEDGLEGTGTPWLEVALVPASALRGRVVDARARPIPDAEVLAEGFFHVLPDVASCDAALARTDANGEFHIAGLRGDITHALAVRAAGHGEQLLEIPAAPGEAVDLGTIVLAAEGLAMGLVLDPEGLPVEDAEIEVELAVEAAAAPAAGLDAGARHESRRVSARTGPEGVFVLDGLPAGRHRVAVWRDGEVLARADLVVEAGSASEELLLLLPPTSRTLVGEVRDAGGALHEADVEIRRLGLVARVRTDKAGRFRVAGLSDSATYELEATAPGEGGLLVARAAARADERLVLRLSPARPDRAD